MNLANDCTSLRGWEIVIIMGMAFGCAEPPRPHMGQSRNELIYGEDSRRDVYAVERELLAQIAVQSTVAFMSAEHLALSSEGKFDIISETLGEFNNLCPSEAFVTQPAAATCSGVLVDDQLVLTAGHCVSEDATCDDQLLVFGYAILDPGGVITLDDEAIYRCKSIPIRRHGLGQDGRRWDYAVIELDRPAAAPRRLVQLATEMPVVGSDVTVIGYPSGLPVKIDTGAEMLYARPCLDYFTTNSDTFQSSSGSGVFDEHGTLSGILVRGGADYEVLPGASCAVSRQILEVTDPTHAEHASYVAPVIASLCASGWPSARLCSNFSAQKPDVSAKTTASCMPEFPIEGEASGGCMAAGRSHGPPDGSVATTMIAILLALRRIHPKARTDARNPRVEPASGRTRRA